MSNAINAFFAKVQETPELQQKLEAVEENLRQQRAELISALSVDAGTPFTASEFLAASEEAAKELDEASLESVAGGFNPFADLRKIFNR